jgi:hypothetical protein
MLLIADFKMITRIREFVKDHQNEIILIIGVILVSLLSFAMGYITAKELNKEPIRIEDTQQT